MVPLLVEIYQDDRLVSVLAFCGHRVRREGDARIGLRD